MIVVADTSPLNYLIILDQAHLLVRLYGQVMVPTAVLTELRHPDAPGMVRSWALSPPSWLEIREVREIDPSLGAQLDAGEREAISLALEVGASLLLIDDRAGREQAVARHIEITGTLTVLFRAGVLGLIDFPAALDRISSWDSAFRRQSQRPFWKNTAKCEGKAPPGVTAKGFAPGQKSQI
jgi:predicted nucleic acid-binding protein